MVGCANGNWYIPERERLGPDTNYTFNKIEIWEICGTPRIPRNLGNSFPRFLDLGSFPGSYVLEEFPRFSKFQYFKDFGNFPNEWTLEKFSKIKKKNHQRILFVIWGIPWRIPQCFFSNKRKVNKKKWEVKQRFDTDVWRFLLSSKLFQTPVDFNASSLRTSWNIRILIKQVIVLKRMSLKFQVTFHLKTYRRGRFTSVQCLSDRDILVFLFIENHYW